MSRTRSGTGDDPARGAAPAAARRTERVPDPDGGADLSPHTRRVTARSIGVVCLAGALLVLAWTFLPHEGGGGTGQVRAMVALAVVLGAAMAAGALDDAPPWALHALIAGLQVVISVAYLAPADADNDIRLLYVWATPVAAFCLSPRSAVWHAVWSGACFGFSLSLLDEPTGVLFRVWLMTMGTLLAVGGLVTAVAAVSRRSRMGLRHAAWHDSLSGLPNRVLFERRVHEALRTLELGDGQVHLLLVDLDHFKLVNDTYGHHAGDELIVTVAPRLQQAAGAGATVARMGGDEFAVVLADDEAGRGLDEVLRRLDAVWQEPVVLSGAVVPVSASVGVVSCGEAGESAESLLRDADVALYRAKQTQRGTVRRFDAGLRVEVERRTRLDHELRSALARGELSLVYQPVVDLGTGRTVAAEALLRWDSAELGAVPPAEFVPVAEENGLVVPIGRFVVERAAGDVARWRAGGVVDDDFSVAVNVSVRQLDATFPDEIVDVLLRHGLPASALTVEITESVLLDGAVRSGDALSRLRTAGTRVALDDFGTGYSSLSYLQRLPMDTLKVDRSFVGELDGERPRTGLVSAVLDLARSLGMDVVAEGVETLEQADRLRALGVRRAQGWLFQRPLPATGFVRHMLLGQPAPAVGQIVPPRPLT